VLSGQPVRLLLTLADLPAPVDGGKRFRSRVALEALAGLGELDVLVLVDASREGAFDASPWPGVRRSAVVGLPLRRPSAAAADVVRRLVPWQIAVRDHAPALAVLRDWGPRRYDLAWFGSRHHVIALPRHVHHARAVDDADDVETAKLRAYLRLPPGTAGTGRLDRIQRRVELPLWWRVQRTAARRADRLTVASDLDGDRIRGAHLRVLPNGYPDPGRPGRLDEPLAGQRPPTLLFVAAYDQEPNLDAAEWAATEILPLVRAQVPDARLQLVGRSAEQLGALSDRPGVEVVGPVAETAPHLAAADVLVVPIRYGGGTRLKVLEAFAHGVPVVSTTLGCEGLGASAEHLLVADDPAAFAAACVQVLRDPAPARERAVAARARYEAHFETGVAVARARAIAAELVG
jgi:glycosyltransferase involved in cell wall biosynthesis